MVSEAETEHEELQVFPAASDEETQSEALTRTAREQMARRDWDAALKTYHQILTLHQRDENLVGIAKVKNDMASVYLAQQEWQTALDLLESSRKIFAEAGDSEQQAVALNNIAAAQYELGATDQSLENYEAALAMRREMEDTLGEAKTLRNIGVLFAKQGNAMKAKLYLNKAITVARDARAPQLVKTIRKSLSQISQRRR
ncbi:MAG: tetratricopeptide repeat protein [Anaerolineae bacterium]|nr:tetratricopeptide repeat protein [Anaerolineae bacterium]